MNRFPKPLLLQWVAPRKAILLKPFVFISPTRGKVTVEKGFDTDYASIPRIFWSVYPPDGSYVKPAVVHDADYWHQAVTREVADATFLEGMKEVGVPLLRRQLIYRSVRAFGWLAWNNNRRAKLAGVLT
jgi:hypothetical protein